MLESIKDTAPELEEEVEQEKAKTADDVFTLAELEEKINAEGKDDPNELIKSRFLCRGSAAILAAQTGCGKSSFVMQMIFNFALGRSCFGLEPKGELKTLLIQGENDQRDLYEELAGVSWGLRNHELLTIPQIEKASQLVTVWTCTRFSGADFINQLEEFLKKSDGIFDLIVIDPLFSFAGVDISKEQGNLSQWLRNGLNTLLRRYNVGAFIVHHANKPTKAASLKDKNYNSTYDYAGSAELANWARAMLVLERFNNDEGSFYFRLSAPKRGKRLGWDEQFLRWAADAIYWEKTTPPVVKTPATTQDAKDTEKKQKLIDKAKQAAKLLKPGEVLSRTDFIERFAGVLSVGGTTEKQNIIAICVGQGFIVQRPPKNEEKRRGVSKVVELPAYPDESSQTEQAELSPT